MEDSDRKIDCVLLITAKGESKRLPNKNFLLAPESMGFLFESWDKLKSGLYNFKVCVSSDSEKLLKKNFEICQLLFTGKEWQHPLDFNFIKRESWLADESLPDSHCCSLYHAYFKMREIYGDRIDENTVFILLQPTSPFREVDWVTYFYETAKDKPEFLIVSKNPYTQKRNGNLYAWRFRNVRGFKNWDEFRNTVILNGKILLPNSYNILKNWNSMEIFQYDLYMNLDIDDNVDFELYELLKEEMKE